MSQHPDISVIILTFNEERHIVRCIENVIDIAKDIFVVDSYSSDRTCELAESLGANIYRNEWLNYAYQFNWALNNLPIKTNWVFRLDADEIATSSLKQQIVEQIHKMPEAVSGLYIKRKLHFMNKWIRHGGMYPMYVLRLFKFGRGHCEQRWMDEHIKITQGTTAEINGVIIDDNRNNLGWWINKHNNYAVRETVDLLNIKYKIREENPIIPQLTGTQEQRRRWLKIRYASLPLFIRPFLYFIYRYFFRLGFLDGRRGLVWHFLHGFWYRFLVDALIFEIQCKGGKDCRSVRRIISREYGIHLK